MILVTGATGNIGSEVARQLVAQGVHPRLFVRNPARARAFEGAVQLAQGDYDDPASIATALAGIDRVFLVSSGEHGHEQELRVVEAAKKAGVRHVVKLSVIAADRELMTFAKWHRSVERALEASGLGWTFVRPGSFMSNILMSRDTLASQGAFYRSTGHGKTAIIDPEDVAAVAVLALTKPGHEGLTYELTGPEPLSAQDEAAVLTRVLGREVRYVDVPPEALRDAMVKAGLPVVYANALLDLYALIRGGHAAGVTDTVRSLLGRAPGSFPAWVQRHKGAFSG